MLNSRQISLFIKRLQNKNIFDIFKKFWQISRNKTLNELLIAIKDYFPEDNEIILMANKDASSFTPAPRYLYLEIDAAVHCKIYLFWFVGTKLYTSRHFDIYPIQAIYMFDLTMLRGSDEKGRNNYSWGGKISKVGMVSDRKCNVKLVKFTDNKFNFQKDKPKVVEIIDYPDIIHFEITRNCNLKCYMCRENRENEVKQIGINNLDFYIFNKMIPFLRNVSHVALFGWGEPLCHPSFKKFIESVGKIKVNDIGDNRSSPLVSFTTNATLLNEDLIRSLINNKIDEIAISIDSSNEYNFNFIRKGADFKQVISNLNKFQEIKKQYGVSYPSLTIEFVAMRRNIEELPNMIELADSLKINRILVYYITVVTKGLEQESLYYYQDLTNRILDISEKKAQAYNINIFLPSRFGSKVSSQGYCDDAQKTFYVKAEGTVIPCCIATDVVIGDLYKESPEEIWHGEPRKKIINNLHKGILQGKCKNCYKFTGNDINLRETHIKV